MAEGKTPLNLEGRIPVPTSFKWDAVQMTTVEGVTENLIVLRIDTAVGMNCYFMTREVALQVAAGIGSYARQLPEEQQSPGLIVPNVDMTDVVKHLNGKKDQP